MNVFHAAAVGFVVVVAPTVAAVLVSPLSIVVSALGLIVGTYLGFGKGVTLRSNYQRLFAMYRDRFRARYTDE